MESQCSDMLHLYVRDKSGKQYERKIHNIVVSTSVAVVVFRRQERERMVHTPVTDQVGARIDTDIQRFPQIDVHKRQ